MIKSTISRTDFPFRMLNSNDQKQLSSPSFSLSLLTWVMSLASFRGILLAIDFDAWKSSGSFSPDDVRPWAAKPLSISCVDSRTRPNCRRCAVSASEPDVAETKEKRWKWKKIIDGTNHSRSAYHHDQEDVIDHRDVFLEVFWRKNALFRSREKVEEWCTVERRCFHWNDSESIRDLSMLRSLLSSEEKNKWENRMNCYSMDDDDFSQSSKKIIRFSNEWRAHRSHLSLFSGQWTIVDG